MIQRGSLNNYHRRNHRDLIKGYGIEVGAVWYPGKLGRLPEGGDI